MLSLISDRFIKRFLKEIRCRSKLGSTSEEKTLVDRVVEKTTQSNNLEKTGPFEKVDERGEL